MKPSNYDVWTKDCSHTKVVLVRGTQADHLRRNPTASHLNTEFVLLGMLGEDDLHVFTTSDKEDLKNVPKVVQEAGANFSKAILRSAPTR
jgi:hypothetical protein